VEKRLENLKEVIKYIEEREENLNKYSDKLRENLLKIVNLFGDSNYCRICGNKQKIYFENIALISEKVKEKFKGEVYIPHDIVFADPELLSEDYKKYAKHKFTPFIQVSIDIKDVEPFREIEKEYEGKYLYYLAFSDHKLVIEKFDTSLDSTEIIYFDEASRETLKEIVKTKALVKFLKYVAEQLKQKEEEFKQVSEIAEKLASIV
jgi:hypothetical protein